MLDGIREAVGESSFAAATMPGIRALESLVGSGGPVVAVLLVMSLAMAAIIILKLLHFRAVRISDRETSRRAVHLHLAGRAQEAEALLAERHCPAARVVAAAIDCVAVRRLDATAARDEVGRVAAEEVEGLRSYLRALEVIAMLAPLLGLFGTVLGMIDVFREMEVAGSRIDPSALSGGIWVALLTTAVGLAVAIPAVVAFNALDRVVERATHEIEGLATQVLVHPVPPSDQSDRYPLVRPALARS